MLGAGEAAGAVFTLAAAGAAFGSAATLELASVAEFVAGAGESAGAAVVSKTERLPFKAGCDSRNAAIINDAAAPIVIFAKTVCVPRAPNAVLEMLLVNKAPASALPGCSKTAATKTTHAKINKP